MKYGELTLGKVEAIVNKLGGMEGVQRFLSGQTEVTAVKFFSEVWATIRLSARRDAKDYAVFKKSLERKDLTIGDWGQDILNTFKVESIGEEVKLVNLSIADLGFGHGADYEDICRRITQLGLEFCPAEVGPQLCLQHGDLMKHGGLSKDKCSIITMKPVLSEDPLFFKIIEDKGVLFLSGGKAKSSFIWTPQTRVISRLNK